MAKSVRNGQIAVVTKTHAGADEKQNIIK